MDHWVRQCFEWYLREWRDSGDFGPDVSPVHYEPEEWLAELLNDTLVADPVRRDFAQRIIAAVGPPDGARAIATHQLTSPPWPQLVARWWPEPATNAEAVRYVRDLFNQTAKAAPPNHSDYFWSHAEHFYSIAQLRNILEAALLPIVESRDPLLADAAAQILVWPPDEDDEDFDEYDD